ncbi:MAG TPA: hypothetical protein VGG20_29590 [Thermoanaerobaculia bacterium]|jgi:hypothetical protein
MIRPGRWISLFPILALVPRLGLVVLAADRQPVTPETRAALLWLSSTALAVLVGLAEVYIGIAVVSKRHGGLAGLWVALTVLLNALIVPLSVSGLEAVPVWEILGSPALQVAWGAGLGLLSTLCVCGCLWADVVREGSGLSEAYEAHLLGRLAEEEKGRSALEAALITLRADAERAASVGAPSPASPPRHAACEICGYWHAEQRKVAGHITQCRRKAAREEVLANAERFEASELPA